MENYESLTISELIKEYEKLKKAIEKCNEDIEDTKKVIAEGNLHYLDLRDYQNDIIADNRQILESKEKIKEIKKIMERKNITF